MYRKAEKSKEAIYIANIGVKFQTFQLSRGKKDFVSLR